MAEEEEEEEAEEEHAAGEHADYGDVPADELARYYPARPRG